MEDNELVKQYQINVIEAITNNDLKQYNENMILLEKEVITGNQFRKIRRKNK